jgi:hypothetical protein
VGSANGIFVNDQPVKTHFIINNDVVFIGKFALWFLYEEDRRGERDNATRLARTQDEGTTVLRTSELQEMIESVRQAEKTAPVDIPAAPATMPSGGGAAGAMVATSVASAAASRRAKSLVVLGLLLAFAAGYVAGGGLRWLPSRFASAAALGAAAETQP